MTACANAWASTPCCATTVTVLSSRLALADSTPACWLSVDSTLPVQCGHIIDGTLSTIVQFTLVVMVESPLNIVFLKSLSRNALDTTNRLDKLMQSAPIMGLSWIFSGVKYNAPDASGIANAL